MRAVAAYADQRSRSSRLCAGRRRREMTILDDTRGGRLGGWAHSCFCTQSASVACVAKKCLVVLRRVSVMRACVHADVRTHIVVVERKLKII